MLNRRDVIGAAIAATAAIHTGARGQTAVSSSARRRSFTPGEIWLDMAGKPIQAHGGSIIQVGDLFYWYGENKEKTVQGSKFWTWGIQAYSSKDLYNWDDLGLIIPPDEKDPTSPLHPSGKLDRPHIIYNAKSRKFVCWIKNLTEPQTRVVLTANAITGPYTIIHKDLKPVGMSAGDFDLVISPDDAKAYMYFERVHTEMICADLTEDYTDFTGYYSTHFPTSGPPEVREAPAYFRRNGKHYLTSSGATGYYPNPSEVAVADTFHGPFTVLGDLHPGDTSRTSYNSQISSIFKHPTKKNLYIALADRWTGPLSGPDFESGRFSALIHNGLARRFGTPAMPVPPASGGSPPEKQATRPISEARYVWLPIRFQGDRPIIEWRSEWRLEEFA